MSGNKGTELEFWHWFASNEQQIFYFEENQPKLFNDLASRLRIVHPNLTFEFSRILESGQREFVISASGFKAAFPAVEQLYESAPDLTRWIWIKYRPRRSQIMDIQLGDKVVKFSDVHYIMAKDGEKVGIVLFFDGYGEDTKTLWGTVGYLFLDQILGEYAVETQVGFVEFQPYGSQYFDRSRPLSELQQHFDHYWVSVGSR